MADPQEPGRFIPPSLPSPAPSHASTTSTSSSLPHPRSHPLKAGSVKEDATRRYLEAKLLAVSRRYVRKFQPADEGEREQVKGYESFVEVARDLGDVLNVLWLSGTPSLQVPYLLNISGSVNQYLPSFPPAPKATFTLLGKLDHAFASLLAGEDSSTSEALPGFSNGRKALSRTDMVRCKALVETTRVLIVGIMSNADLEADGEESVVESDVEMDGMDDYGIEDDGGDDMNIARVYEKTIVQLGEQLGGLEEL